MSVHATPTPLKDAEQSVEGPQAKAQPSMPTGATEDTRPKVLIRGEWRKVPDAYPKDAPGQLELQLLVASACCVALYLPAPIWCTNGGACKHAFMLAPSQCLRGL